MGEKFEPKQLDFILSPYTGMTRETWIEAAKYMLEGIFRHIHSFSDPVVVARTETEITYPHKNSSPEFQDAERRAEIFEGLTRSFFIAAPMIHIDPELKICGYSIREYYKSHVLRVCTKGDPVAVGDYEDLQEMTHHQDPTRAFQQTVETCALVICLWCCKEEIWDTYRKEEKDTIAAFLTSFAHAPTVPQNWRLFNMLDMAFLNMEGYPIDRDVMREHAQEILAYYSGDGWYRDGHSFDYYSCWAFQFYAPLWNVWYGYEHEPYLAKRFEENSNRLMETYADFFDRDGYTNMWGRSCIYRCASVSAFEGNLLLNDSILLRSFNSKSSENVSKVSDFLKDSEERRLKEDGEACLKGSKELGFSHTEAEKYPGREAAGLRPGLARRIASGSLLQFFTREDFRMNGVPTMGFYGQFSPLVQGYSCAESVFWMGKAFLCLHFPADHPFWTDTETNGTWEIFDEINRLGKAYAPGNTPVSKWLIHSNGEGHGNVADGRCDLNVKVTTLDGPALSFSNHAANGSTVLRTGKVVKNVGDRHGMWNYGKLCYHTKYPWEAGDSMQYTLKDIRSGHIERCNVTFWAGERDGVLYRRQFFEYRLDRECQWMQAVNLADIAVPYGILRADKLRLYRWPVEVTLGSFGFPDNGTEIIYKEDSAARPDDQGGNAARQANQKGNLFEPGEKNPVGEQETESLKVKKRLYARAIILKGTDATGKKKQLAMTIWDGWDEISCARSTGTNPDSEHSIVIYAKMTREKMYGNEPHFMISQVITREDHENFAEEDLFPIEDIIYTDPEGTGGYGPVKLKLKNGEEKIIDFDGIEGRILL
ncbi:MAG: DUF2264 domain-containing protein [Lachnospiraceae bacterium]|nr:DUF2264 domain-containing protein [Lachnospiraceae bacterium]